MSDALSYDCKPCGAVAGRYCDDYLNSVCHWRVERAAAADREARRREHLDRITALAKALPINEEADRAATAALNRRRESMGPPVKLQRLDWAWMLGNALREAGVLCEAFAAGFIQGYDDAAEGEGYPRSHERWNPGCGRPAMGPTRHQRFITGHALNRTEGGE